jgi:hypothetical protein
VVSKLATNIILNRRATSTTTASWTAQQKAYRAALAFAPDNEQAQEKLKDVMRAERVTSGHGSNWDIKHNR